MLYNVRMAVGKRREYTAKEGKCLAVVYECAKEGVDPSALAVSLILHGEDAAKGMGHLKTFGCLTSYSTKKVKSMIALLLKKGYLLSYAPVGLMERYLILSESGEKIAERVLSKGIRKSPLPPAAPLFNERN